MTIAEIRVTSPQYCTADGIHVGSTYAAILRAFPTRAVASNPADVNDPAGGAFEFAAPPAEASRCIALHVSARGPAPSMTDAKQVTDLLAEGKG